MSVFFTDRQPETGSGVLASPNLSAAPASNAGLERKVTELAVSEPPNPPNMGR